MFRASCTVDGEWDGGAVEPYGDLRVSPAAAVLNYGRIWQYQGVRPMEVYKYSSLWRGVVLAGTILPELG
jgi:hypothetical protein